MLKILIVDDQEPTRKMLRMALGKHADDLIEAPNGMTGLREIREKRPHVVLFDILMPGTINGFQGCEMIKSDKALKDTFVILISGLGEQRDFDEARRVGANAYFVKPFRLGRMVEVISNYKKFEKEFILEDPMGKSAAAGQALLPA